MAYFEANATTSISAGSPPKTPLGELTVLPTLPSWILWAYTSKGKEKI